MTAFLVGAAALLIAAVVVDRRHVHALIRRLASLDPRAAARAREVRTAFPVLVEGVAAALGSGLSLPLAFAEVAPTLPRPLDSATARVAASLSLGRRIAPALEEYRGLVPDEDVAPLAVVLGAFERTGGRIARSLRRVAALVRGRLALAAERDALTAQGRVSAFVLIALAPLGAVFFAVATPGYVRTFATDGRALFAAAVVLEFAGALWLMRLLRTKDGLEPFASLLDAVVVGLDAGLTFEQSLREIVDRAPRVGRLPEARLLLADLALGRGASVAFAHFGAAGADERRVSAIVGSAGRFGAPLADLLVVQADALREADRRRTEAAARRLPVQMLFPLTFCVLPALLIVFLGPPVLSLVS